MKTMKKLIFIGILLLGFNVAGCTNSDTSHVKHSLNDTITIKQDSPFVLNQKLVYKMIVDAEIQYPEIVLRQAVLETGHFKSNACINKYNLFGFQGKNGLYTYSDYQESVNRYKSWQSVWYMGGDYYEFLDQSGYSEDSTYVETLKRIKIDV